MTDQSATQPEVDDQRAALRKYISDLASSPIVDNGIAYNVLPGTEPARPNIEEAQDLQAKLILEQKRRLARYGAIESTPANETAAEKRKDPDPDRAQMAARITSLEVELDTERKKQISRWSEPKTWLQILAIACMLILVVKLVVFPLTLRIELHR